MSQLSALLKTIFVIKTVLSFDSGLNNCSDNNTKNNKITCSSHKNGGIVMGKILP